MKKPIYLLMLFLVSTFAYSQPKLSSLPSAKATVFLDFDGQYVTATPWQGGNSFYCSPSGLDDRKVTEVFNRVAEDFRPFEINITTDSSVFLQAPLDQRVRIIVTPTSQWFPNVGGVSFTGSFIWGDGTPAFVFPDKLAYSSKIIAEAISHETGHTLGLSHQSKYNDNCGLLEVYNEGKGAGQIGWAPIMGNSYYKNVSSWNNGPTPNGCQADQDNLSIITGINGFGYRTDDHFDDPALGATPIEMNGNRLAAGGIISTNTDKDVFEMNIEEGSSLTLNAVPFAVDNSNSGANLDVKVTLLDDDFKVLRVYDPGDRLDVAIDTLVDPGKYYLVVAGSANENNTGYGSLGSYNISGEYMAIRIMPIRELKLTGIADGNNHLLSWNIISDEPLAALEVEVSYDDVNFKSLANVAIDERKFSFSPMQTGEAYYRIRAQTVIGETRYSNVVTLKQAFVNGGITVRSNVVSGQIEIIASEDYRFILADLNGRVLKKGSGAEGSNSITLPQVSSKIFVIQIISNSQRITQRIVRM